MNAKLDAVSKSRQAYLIAKSTLESRLREQMKIELMNLQTQVDIAIRLAYESGESKSSIMRAMGTKDYGTMQQSLDRTQGVAEIVGTNPLDSVYEIDGDLLYVRYVNHGSQAYNGVAEFKIKKLDNGNILLLSNTPLWNDDYTKRNDAVAALDGKSDGEYYDEVIRWILSAS
jgi:hypothetical protein